MSCRLRLGKAPGDVTCEGYPDVPTVPLFREQRRDTPGLPVPMGLEQRVGTACHAIAGKGRRGHPHERKKHDATTARSD